VQDPTREPTLPPGLNCGCASCTSEVLNRLATDGAGTFTCGSRINWLLDNGFHDVEEDACKQIAHDEFPDVCGPSCDPLRCDGATREPTKAPTMPPVQDPTREPTLPPGSNCGCASCTNEVLNRLATDGAGTFTCGSRINWLLDNGFHDVEEDACKQIAHDDFAGICGPDCDPLSCDGQNTIDDPDPSTLIWSDEFEGPNGSAPDPQKWGYDIGGNGWGNNERQYYTNRRENSFLSNGILNIRAVKEDFATNQYTSARLVSKGLGDWTYGRFRVKARLQQCTGLGTWPAIWMLPTDWFYGGWPDSGEIDIMEHVGYDTGKIHGSVHTRAFNHLIGTQKSGTRVVSDVGDWHIYDVIWTENKIEFIMDGIRYYTFSKVDNASYREWPFDKRFHLLLNVAVGGDWGGAGGFDPVAFEGNGQIMEVDWVRVYS